MNHKKNCETDLCTRRGKVGGQAVLEGVMMRAGTECATACRTPEGEIALDKRQFVSVRKKHKALNIPVFRGVVNFVEMLKLSFSTLTVSAKMMGVDEEAQEGPIEKWMKKRLGVGLFDVLMVIATVLGVFLSLFLFLFLPTLCADGITYLIGRDYPVLRALIEGVMKILIFILYIVLVSLSKDIRRTFEYHGAEHKTIACFEAGEELTPANAKKHTRFHPRCGTSFMFVMILLGIFAGVFVRLIAPSIPKLAYTGVRLLLLPFIMGIGFEFIMFAGRHDNAITRALSAPGLWMQRLTTKEPDEAQLEIAIIATKAALPEDFPDFDAEPYVQVARRIEAAASPSAAENDAPSQPPADDRSKDSL